MRNSLDDPNFIKNFTKIIDERIDKKMSQLSYDIHIPATVTSTPTGIGGTCSVKLNGETLQTITNVQIRYGLSLTYGQKVWLLYINNSKNNFLIDF